jgi:acetylornithine deacetylase/succinyl-diaminopimelate desuccinylase-like protein
VDPRHPAPATLASYVDKVWESEIIPQLSSYVTIRCLSPEFDPGWEARGEIARAARMLADWAGSRPLRDCAVEIATREGRTPAVIADVAATPGAEGRRVTLMYGHFDKQPAGADWRSGLDPFAAVREGDRLYGRGTVDDGYSFFSAISALEALEASDTAHGRCVILLEGSEESGSPDLAPYFEEVAARIGAPGPGLVVCLDSGCSSYDRLWNTISLRGSLAITLRVEVLSEGVHSGTAGGVVPSSFRLLRQLLSRIEDEATGEILVPECNAEPPQDYRAAIEAVASEFGEAAVGGFPTVPTLELTGKTVADRVLRVCWMPALAVTGIDGIPSVNDGSNTLRPFTTLKLSVRLPPPVDPDLAAQAIVRTLSADPPQGAKVTAAAVNTARGFFAPPQAEWLSSAAREASEELFGNAPAMMGEGGTIPFMADLRTRFKDAQFLISGVLGPDSNGHGPNEMLELKAAKHFTACVAFVVACAP